MLVVVRKSKVQEEAGVAEIQPIAHQVPVRSEAPETKGAAETRRFALYFIVTIIDTENNPTMGKEKGRGLMGGEGVIRVGGRFVLTDKANNAIETISIPNQRPEVINEAIENLVWDERTLRAKAEKYKSIEALWKGVSGKSATIHFTSSESTDLAYDVLLEAGFTPEMLKRSKSGTSIKIVGVPEEFNVDALKARLAKDFTHIKKETVAVETKIAEETRTAERGKRKSEKDKQWAIDFEVMEKINPEAAAQRIADTYNDPSPSGGESYLSWYYLNLRDDREDILALLRGLWPFGNLTDREFNHTVEMLTNKAHFGKPVKELLAEFKKDPKNKGKSESDLTLYLFQTSVDKPLAGIADISLGQKKVATGREHAEVKEHDKRMREMRGEGPSELEVSAATPWKIPKSFRDQLDSSSTTLFYTFPSADRYAEARATVEALYPGRAVAVEHTAEFQGGKDVGEWVMTVHPPGVRVDPGFEVAGNLRSTMENNSANMRLPWVRRGKKAPVTFAEAAYDATNRHSKYTAEVTINSGDTSTVPGWFKPLVVGGTYEEMKEKAELRNIVLSKGADFKVELIRTVENDDDTKSYTYRVTISGENIGIKLQAARSKAPAKEESYANRIARLQRETEKRG